MKLSLGQYNNAEASFNSSASGRSQSKAESENPFSQFLSGKKDCQPLAYVERGKEVTFKDVPFVYPDGTPVSKSGNLEKSDKSFQQRMKSRNHNIPDFDDHLDELHWKEIQLTQTKNTDRVITNFKDLASKHLKSTRELRHGILTGKTETPGLKEYKGSRKLLNSGQNVGNEILNQGNPIASLIAAARSITNKTADDSKLKIKSTSTTRENLEKAQLRKQTIISPNNFTTIKDGKQQPIEKNIKKFDPPRIEKSKAKISSTVNENKEPVAQSGIKRQNNKTSAYGLTSSSRQTVDNTSANISKTKNSFSRGFVKPENNLSMNVANDSNIEIKPVNQHKSENNSKTRIQLSGITNNKDVSTKRNGNYTPKINRQLDDSKLVYNRGDDTQSIKLEKEPDTSINTGEKTIKNISSTLKPTVNQAKVNETSTKEIITNNTDKENVSETKLKQADTISFTPDQKSKKTAESPNNRINEKSLKSKNIQQESQTSKQDNNQDAKSGNSENHENVKRMLENGWHIHTPKKNELRNSRKNRAIDKSSVKSKSVAKNEESAQKTSDSKIEAKDQQVKADNGEKSFIQIKESLEVEDNLNIKSDNQEKVIKNTTNTNIKQSTDVPNPGKAIENLQEILKAVKGQARILNSNGTITVDVQLKPRQLGIVFAQIKNIEGKYEVVLNADNPEAVKAIEPQLDSIKAQLSNSGINIQKMEISLGNPEQNYKGEEQKYSQGQKRSGSNSNQDLADSSEEMTSSIEAKKLNLGTNTVDFIG